MASLRTVLLWTLAFLLMAAAAIHQRRTGPTHPKRGEFSWNGQVHTYRLLRSQERPAGATIQVPDPGGSVRGELVTRRYPTQDPWTALPMTRGEQRGRPVLTATLPVQPPAGKMEYQVRLLGGEQELRIPATGTLVLRYKDPVPMWLLLCHVACMFLGMLVGIRTGLAAWWEPSRVRVHTLVTLGLLTLGGMVLGPFVQKHAFGAYWTGWPVGGDLTDDKTAVLWLAWVGAGVAVLWVRQRPRLVRGIVIVATLVMLAVYLIPHSARGSQLDYQQGQVTTGRPG